MHNVGFGPQKRGPTLATPSPHFGDLVQWQILILQSSIELTQIEHNIA